MLVYLLRQLWTVCLVWQGVSVVLVLLLQEATIFELPPDLGMPQALGNGEQIQFPEAAYGLDPGNQGDYASPVLRLSYNSLTTPSSVIDVNMKTGKRCSCHAWQHPCSC